MSDDFIRRREFDAVKLSFDREIKDIKLEQDKLASKDDMTLQTQFLTLKIEGSASKIAEAEKARKDKEDAKWRMIQFMFWGLGGVGTLLGIISLIVTLSNKIGKG